MFAWNRHRFPNPFEQICFNYSTQDEEFLWTHDSNRKQRSDVDYNFSLTQTSPLESIVKALIFFLSLYDASTIHALYIADRSERFYGLPSRACCKAIDDFCIWTFYSQEGQLTFWSRSGMGCFSNAQFRLVPSFNILNPIKLWFLGKKKKGVSIDWKFPHPLKYYWKPPY